MRDGLKNTVLSQRKGAVFQARQGVPESVIRKVRRLPVRSARFRPQLRESSVVARTGLDASH